MANLLLTPANWSLLAGVSWTGSAYHRAVNNWEEAQFGMTLTGDRASGDVVAGAVLFANSAYGEPPLPGWLNLVQSPGTVLGSVSLSTSGPTAFSFDVPTDGGAISLVLTSSAGGTSAVSFYGLEITLTPTEVPPPECEEIGPVTRVNVSAYRRTRVHYSRLHRGERRCLIANFNGAIPPSRSIVSATWRTYANNVAFLANPRITGREVEVDLTAGYPGRAGIKLEATLNNGERYMQTFVVEVTDVAWFPADTTPGSGPTELRVDA